MAGAAPPTNTAGTEARGCPGPIPEPLPDRQPQPPAQSRTARASRSLLGPGQRTQPHRPSAPKQRRELDPVLERNGDAVATLHAGFHEQTRAPIGEPIQLLVRGCPLRLNERDRCGGSQCGVLEKAMDQHHIAPSGAHSLSTTVCT
jgi:hypothetical protein